MALGRGTVPRDDEFNKKAIPKFNCERAGISRGILLAIAMFTIKSAVFGLHADVWFTAKYYF